ncbi:hypothetical protein B0H19DRAFT_1074328 [Mycena capillaripes]|nr:hypothetical protein B0H19DRAFT_1074328 [Mycena capillaripes]
MALRLYRVTLVTVSLFPFLIPMIATGNSRHCSQVSVPSSPSPEASLQEICPRPIISLATDHASFYFPASGEKRDRCLVYRGLKVEYRHHQGARLIGARMKGLPEHSVAKGTPIISPAVMITSDSAKNNSVRTCVTPNISQAYSVGSDDLGVKSCPYCSCSDAIDRESNKYSRRQPPLLRHARGHLPSAGQNMI